MSQKVAFVVVLVTVVGMNWVGWAYKEEDRFLPALLSGCVLLLKDNEESEREHIKELFPALLKRAQTTVFPESLQEEIVEVYVSFVERQKRMCGEVQSHADDTSKEEEKDAVSLEPDEWTQVNIKGMVIDQGELDHYHKSIIHSTTELGEMEAAESPDCAVLAVLHEQTGGSQWIDTTGWDIVSTSCCTGGLYGVTCDEEKRVTELELDSNQLAGLIPAELGNLSQLQKMDLSYNQLEGSIPITLGQLLHLRVLSLSSNQLSGPIPIELGLLSQLQGLSLASNQITGSIPVELGQLSQLQKLILYSNQLTGLIPTELGGLSQLQQLVLYSNQLTGSIPVQLGLLSQLRWLSLSSNQLTGSIPVQLGHLLQLQVLSLYSNHISGPIPVEFCQMLPLQRLYLYSNQLTGSIPAELGQLSQLQWLFLYSNQLTGSIPEELGQLLHLQMLSLHSNRLTGSITAKLRQLLQLQELDLSSNQLTGSIPADLGQLWQLRRLRLSSNQLVGLIPSSLGQLSRLEELDVHMNYLAGQIPTAFCNMTSLSYVDLGWNGLTGDVESLCCLMDITVLCVAGNYLSRFCDSSTFSCLSVELLSLSHNHLTQFPYDVIPRLESLYTLDLSYNALGGSFPDALFSSNGTLRILNLKANLFEGYLPIDPCRGLGSRLTSLNVANNTITNFFFGDRERGIINNTCFWCNDRQFSLVSLDLSHSIRNVTFIDAWDSSEGIEFCVTPLTSPLQLLLRLSAMQDLGLRGWPLSEGVNKLVMGLPVLQRLDVTKWPSMKQEVALNSKGHGFSLSEHEPLPITTSYDCYRTQARNGTMEVLLDATYWEHRNCFCRSGYWGKPPDCRECKSHSRCPGQWTGREQGCGDTDHAYKCSGWVFADEGYWGTPSSSVSEMKADTRYPVHFLACTGVGTGDSPCLADENGPCRRGYHGRRCSECDAGFFPMGSNCVRCPQDIWLIVFAVVICLAVVGLVILSFFYTEKTGGLLKILVFFVQALSFMSAVSPEGIYDVSSAGAYVFGLQLAGSKCYIKNWGYHERYIATLLTPLVTTLLISAIYWIGRLYRYAVMRRRVQGRSPLGLAWKKRCVRSWIFLLFLQYMAVSAAILSPLPCEKDPATHEMYMKNAQNEECSQSLRGVSISLIFLYILMLPIAVLYLIRWRLHQVKDVFGILLSSYTEQWNFWEIFVALRRIIFVCAFLLLSEYSAMRAVWVEVVLCVSILAQAIARPFSRPIDNMMELESLAILIVNHVTATKLHNVRVEDVAAARWTIFVLNLLMICLAAALIVRDSGKGCMRMMKCVIYWSRRTTSDQDEMQMKAMDRPLLDDASDPL